MTANGNCIPDVSRFPQMFKLFSKDGNSCNSALVWSEASRQTPSNVALVEASVWGKLFTSDTDKLPRGLTFC